MINHHCNRAISGDFQHQITHCTRIRLLTSCRAGMVILTRARCCGGFGASFIWDNFGFTSSSSSSSCFWILSGILSVLNALGSGNPLKNKNNQVLHIRLFDRKPRNDMHTDRNKRTVLRWLYTVPSLTTIYLCDFVERHPFSVDNWHGSRLTVVNLASRVVILTRELFIKTNLIPYTCIFSLTVQFLTIWINELCFFRVHVGNVYTEICNLTICPYSTCSLLK